MTIGDDDDDEEVEERWNSRSLSSGLFNHRWKVDAINGSGL